MKIMEWPQQERPRERLLRDGANSLSDAELLAIFLRTGTRGYNVVELSRHLLNHFGGLRQLLEVNLKEFSNLPGMGVAKFCQLQASLELSKRYLQQSLNLEQTFSNPDQVKQLLSMELSHLKREQFMVLFLNNQHQLLAQETLFQGTINSSEVHPRVVVEKALGYHAAAVILAHNHPSGCIDPSPSDRHITEKLRQALELMDIRTLDHIIIAHNKSYSFAEHGLL
ncbi:RadC family protein [Kangiella sediminilitoris]|uniref:DNA repair protein RadC n=1 Tax=Kangiella sediminilitoris TaxID=1144748 RepID=A0A1B3B8I2_9GAMM|nr:DNA repair protein RadC [Kangiella sediminilitoris]AOE49109.1 DNA repair protein RadC [Kangiella sediminilitoris]